MRIFFGGPLTDLKEKEKTKEFYRRMADVAEKNGFEWFWAFLNGTDPIKNPEVPSEVVYETDLAELAKSDLMIVYLGEPTTGTGQEIEYAKEHNIPVYLLFEQGKQITRMVLGSPNIKEEIEFTSEDDALSKLDSLLKRLKTSTN
ncbi:MAG: nucleoside 2-deoxyribosyltransferase [Patescibacteria group bacterium]